jgi:hypothetical protein
MKNSPYTDGELLEIASDFKKHLKSNFSTIKSVYPELDQNFIFKFKALYYEVHTHPSESDNVIESYNADLKDFGDQVRILIPIFRFYMQKAFPYDSNLWEAYGYCEIESVVRDYFSLGKLLEGAVKLINEKRSELRATKCPDQTLSEIIGLTKQVGYKHQELMDYLEKKETNDKAHKSRMEELFQLMEIVHKAASKSLKDDPESLKYLTFPPKGEIQ